MDWEYYYDLRLLCIIINYLFLNFTFIHLLKEGGGEGGERGVNFNYLPWSGGIWKIKKRGWKYGAETGLKVFKVYHFYI